MQKRQKYQWFLDDPYKYLQIGHRVRWFGLRKGEAIMHPYTKHFEATIFDRRKALSGAGYVYTIRLECDGSIIDDIFWANMVPLGMESSLIKETGIISELPKSNGAPRFRKDIEKLEQIYCKYNKSSSKSA